MENGKELAEVERAAAVIRAFCNKRTGDYACKDCPFRPNCGAEPYAWQTDLHGEAET